MKGCALTLNITGVILKGLKSLCLCKNKMDQEVGITMGRAYGATLPGLLVTFACSGWCLLHSSIVDWEKGSMSRL